MSERPRRFTEVFVVLTSIDKDDSEGESETKEGDVLDCQLCSSDEMSDNEETERFDDAQPIVHIGDLQNFNTNIEIHSATCYDNDSDSGPAESSSTNETARDGTKWEFMEFGVKHEEGLQLRMSQLSNLVYQALPLEWQTSLLVLFKLYLITICSNTFNNVPM